jgi:hypothetical protein
MLAESMQLMQLFSNIFYPPTKKLFTSFTRKACRLHEKSVQFLQVLFFDLHEEIHKLHEKSMQLPQKFV